MFPVEIWEQILKHVDDPVDLVRLSIVCKSWYMIVPKIFKQTDKWYKKCWSTIPEKMWSSILEQQHHDEVHWQDFHEARNYPNVWIALYRSWINWRKLLEKSSTVKTYKPIAEHRPLERISCVAVLSNIIAVGSTEGYMMFYDIAKNFEYRIDHAAFIQDVQLWRNGANHIIATSSFANGRINHWNLKDQVLEHRSRGLLISASFQYCYVLNSNNILIVERPGTDRGNSEEEWVSLAGHRYELPLYEKFFAIGADGQELMLWTDGNTHCHVNINIKDCRYKDIFVEPPKIPIRCYRIFKSCVIGCIGELGEFGFSIGQRNWKIYNLFSLFYAPVTAILFHVAVLVLGLQSGEVHVFSVKDVDSLDRLNFDTMKSMKITLDTDAIISLNAMEHDSVHYIVAATDKKLHLVKFH